MKQEQYISDKEKTLKLAGTPSVSLHVKNDTNISSYWAALSLSFRLISISIHVYEHNSLGSSGNIISSRFIQGGPKNTTHPYL